MTLPVRRSYVGAAVQCTLTSAITGASSSISLTGDTTAWNDTANGPFYIVVDPGLASEEKILVGSRSTSTLSSLTRGVDGTSAQSHSAGAIVYPIFTAVDADEANKLASTMTTKGDLLVTDGSTPNRLAVGSNNQFLVADSAATNGVKWTGTLSGATVALGSNTVSGTKAEFDTAVTDDNFAYVGTANTFTTNQVISASSSSDLLRITQTGAGNALLVEDSTNPDSTPFIIDASGRLVAGNSGTATTYQGAIPSIQSLGTGAGASSFLAGRYSADAQGPAYYLTKSRSATIGSESAVSSGDRLGNIYFSGSDGTNQILGVSIAGEAEGTISTGVVPGRFVFFTSSSAGTPTERMRIDSTGAVSIGGAAPAGRSFTIPKALTGSTSSIAFISNGSAQSDVTVQADSIRSGLTTAAASFTLTNLTHFNAAPPATPGAGSTITSQFGFVASSTMTGGTNNYGFYGDLASATGRWNLYMNGTAANYMLGRLGVGATLTSGAMAQVTNTTAADKAFVVKGAASQSGTYLELQNSAGTPFVTVGSAGQLYFNTVTDVSSIAGVTPDIQVSGTGNDASVGVARFSADTSPGRLVFTKSRNATIGSHTVVASGDNVMQVHAVASDGTGYIELARITAAVDGTPNTNDMPGRITFSTTASGGTTLSERMRIDSAGQVGIGAAPSAGRSLDVSKNITGSTTSRSGYFGGVVQSDVTTLRTVDASPSIAASHTVTNVYHLFTGGASLASGAAITNQMGVLVSSTMTQATNNYGFYGDIASGTNRYNLYMNGTAANYMAGRLGVGATLTSGAMAQVTNTTAADIALIVKGAASQTGDLFEVQNSAGTAQFEISSAGAVSIGSTQAATSLNLTKNISGSVNSQALRIASPVATGVTGEARYISIVPSVDASVALGNLVGTKVFGATLGASASITTQYGFWAASDITAATTNYGFYGDIASGTGRWNLYMNGTAANYLAGNVCVGTNSQATSADKAIHMGNGTAPTASITGGVLYVEAGALKYRGSSGTITTIANA